MQTADHLEPRERDPKAIRITVIVLVAIMLGGVFVAQAYVKLLKRQSTEFRPEYKERLVDNLQLVRHDREAVPLHSLKGQVWLCAVIVTTQSETGKLGRSVMKEMAETFADREDVKFLLVTVDPESDRPDQLKAFAEAEGMSLPQWWLVGAEGEELRKYVKNEMRYGRFPHQAEDGHWVFDTDVMIVDRTSHIRGHFDFDRAQLETDKKIKESGENPEYVQQLKEHLEKTINYLIKNAQ